MAHSSYVLWSSCRFALISTLARPAASRLLLHRLPGPTANTTRRSFAHHRPHPGTSTLFLSSHGPLVEPPPSHRRPPDHTRRPRQQFHYPEPHFVAPLTIHPAAPFDIERQAECQEPQDTNPCLHGLRCWPRTITMGQGSRPLPGQDRTHEGRSRHLLASRNPRKQPQTRAGQ